MKERKKERMKERKKERKCIFPAIGNGQFQISDA